MVRVRAYWYLKGISFYPPSVAATESNPKDYPMTNPSYPNPIVDI